MECNETGQNEDVVFVVQAFRTLMELELEPVRAALPGILKVALDLAQDEGNDDVVRQVRHCLLLSQCFFLLLLLTWQAALQFLPYAAHRFGKFIAENGMLEPMLDVCFQFMQEEEDESDPASSNHVIGAQTLGWCRSAFPLTADNFGKYMKTRYVLNPALSRIMNLLKGDPLQQRAAYVAIEVLAEGRISSPNIPQAVAWSCRSTFQSSLRC